MQQLHYLYERRGTGRELFVYYCARCDCVLKVRRDLGPIGETMGSLDGLCASCGRPLVDSVECRVAQVPEEWSDVFFAPAPRTDKGIPLFRQASAFPHFSLGFPPLDSLLRPLKEGRLVVVSGEASSAVAELAAFRAQLPVEAGGLDSAALFVDGGNRSDPYTFSSFVRQRRLRPANAMRRIATCRVFTFYQLASLISQHLTRAVEDYGTKLVVISDVLGTFNEPELEEREARRVLKAVDEGIRSAKKQALVLATLPSPNKYDGYVAEWADVMASLAPARGSVRAELLKHANRLPGSTSFKMRGLLSAAAPKVVA